jgi:glycosyltransferase 2 family protein
VGTGTTATGVRWVRRKGDAISAGAGLAVLIVGMIVVRNGTVSGFEEAVFDAMNGLPGALYPLVWPFQQLGAILVGPVVAIVAAILRRWRLAAAAIVATGLKLVLEREVKDIVRRERPGTSIGPDIELRGDVHVDGASFVSGHAVLVTALAGIIAPYLSGRWKYLPWVIVGLVCVARVYVGAHNPLDVICGAGLGLAIAGVLNFIFGVPARRTA